MRIFSVLSLVFILATGCAPKHAKTSGFAKLGDGDNASNSSGSTGGTSSLIQISGTIVTENGSPVGGATVELSGDSAQTTMTDASGSYSFSVKPGGNYTVTPSRDNDPTPTNGVTGLSAIEIRNQVLGTPLSSPFQIIAADTNGDGQVTTADVSAVNRVLLGQTTGFVQAASTAKTASVAKSATPTPKVWTFVDSSHDFADPNHPFPYPQTISYSNLNASTSSRFVGVKLGVIGFDPCKNSGCAPIK